MDASLSTPQPATGIFKMPPATMSNTLEELRATAEAALNEYMEAAISEGMPAQVAIMALVQPVAEKVAGL